MQTGRWQRIAGPVAVVALLATTVPLALSGAAAPGDAAMATVTGVSVDRAIAEIWRATDGPVAEHAVSRAWTWGPAALAATVEYSADSPTGVRRMVYFDKGRMDILEGAESPDSDWYVTGALLVAQMLAGQIPFAEDGGVARPSPRIAVAGDLDQPNPLTYAMLAPLASIDGYPISGGNERGEVAPARIGAPVTAVIAPDGSVIPDGLAGSEVVIGAYDEITGHNIAAPFADWADRQPVHPVWLTGRPLTEPYWTRTVVAGEATLVLVQAFERRILTYTPGQPAGWVVESNNAGVHYRLWRGLYQPDAAAHVSLASEEPFGEEIVGAALGRDVDPFLLAAIARAASGGNPLATQSNGGVGLLAVRPEVASELGGGDVFDPRLNALLAATELRRVDQAREDDDLHAILSSYFAGNRPDADVATLVEAALANYALLLERHTGGGDAPPVAGGDPNSPIAAGQAAYYSPSYDRAWWERTMRFYASFGMITDSWQYDPNGYYCVKPGYIPGQRLRLVANGLEITCTIGDTVASGDVAAWNTRWAVELNWDAFIALDLDRRNVVEVFHIGPVG